MSRQHGPFQALRPILSIYSTARLLNNLSRPAIAFLTIALASCCIPTIGHAQSLTWDPASNATKGTDGTGAWNTTGNYWYGTTDGPWASGDNAIIGSGGALTNTTYNSSGLLVAGTNIITMGPSITVGGSITLGTTTGAGYSILDNSGTNSAAPSDPLVLSNSLTALTITDNNASFVTGISPSIQAANPFTLNIAGSGTLGLGGTIGTASNPATLKTSGYTSDVFLDGNNNLASTTVSSGATVSVTNSTTSGGSLGPSTAGVTLAGGTLQLIQGAIGVNNSTSQPTGSGTASGYYNPITGTNATGAYSVSNWNNFQTGGKTTNFAVQSPSTYGTALLDNIGVPTTASVTKVTGNNGYSMKSGADPSSALSGNQQMLYSGPNSSGTGTGLSTMQISNIPYASYSVYAYVFNNNVTTANYASLASSSTSYYFSMGATGSNSTANPSPILLPIASGDTSSTSPMADVEDSSSQYEGMYAVWSGQSTSSATVSVYANGSGNPWLAGVEIVAAPVNIANTVSVTSSSTIKLGSYVNVPTISGALNVGSGLTLSFTANNSLSSLAVTGTTTFSGAQGTLSPSSAVTLQLANLADGGNGFKTTGAGTVILTADSSSTLSGPVSIGGATQLSMSSVTSGSATGGGALTIASGGSLTVPLGTLSGYTGLQNNPSVTATQTIFTYSGLGIVSPSSTTVNSGGSIIGPTTGGTLDINSSLSISGTVTANSGALEVGGATTVHSGGIINTDAGSLAIASSLNPLSGAVLDAKFSSAASPPSPQISASGLLTLNQNLTVNVTQGAGFTSGYLYPLVHYGSLADNSSNQTGWSITGGPAGTSPAVINDASNANVGVAFLTAQTSYNSSAGTPGSSFGTAASWSVGNGATFAGYVSEASSQSTGGSGAANGYGPLLATDGSGNNLNALILAGSNSGVYTGGAAASLQMAWRNRTLQETTYGEGGTPTAPPLTTTGAALISNVLNLTGMTTTGGEPAQTDPFVLQMNYDAALLVNEASAAQGGDLYLAWLNPNGAGSNVAQWQNSTTGNFGGNGSDVGTNGLNFQGSFGAYLAEEEALDPTDFPGDPSAANLTSAELNLLLGAYGVDTSNHDVWAVDNHNSEFAVVPEPSSIALAAFGFVACLWSLRRRSPAVA